MNPWSLEPTNKICVHISVFSFDLVSVGKHHVMLASIRWPTWWLKNIKFLRLEKLYGCFCSTLTVIIYLDSELLSDLFCTIWLNLSRIHYATPISSHQQYQASSSVNTSDPVPLPVIHTYPSILLPPCLTDDMYASDLELFLPFSIFFVFPSVCS